MPSALSEVILIITAAFIGGFAARSIKLPPVLGYITSGIVFGIIGRGFFDSYNSLVSLSSLGVSLLLFTLGFEISLDVFKKVSKKTILIGILQVLFTAMVFLPIFTIFKFSFQVSLLFALLFSFSSTAVVVKLLEEKGQLFDFPGNNVFIYLLIQDLFVIPVIFLMPVIFEPSSISFSSIFGFLVSSLRPLAIFFIILFLIRTFLSSFLNFLFRYPSHELTILATIFTATGAVFLFTSVGVPQSIAAFLAGVLISEQGKNLAPLSEIRPFRDVFLVLFFVMTGMLVSFNYMIQNIPEVVVLAVIIIGVKFLLNYLVLAKFGYTSSSSIFISSYLANVGEFAPIIAQVAFIQGLLSQGDYNFLLSVFVLSLLSIPLTVKYLRLGAARLGKSEILKPHFNNLSETPQIPYHNHVVICGHGRVGREVRALLDFANIPYIVVDFNKKIVTELITGGKYAIYADPSDEDVLRSAFIDSARVLVIAIPDSFSQKRIVETALSSNPKIIILCRSHNEDDRYDLINKGVNTIVVPELEAGLRIGTEVLSIFNVESPNINDFVKKLRREHLL